MLLFCEKRVILILLVYFITVIRSYHNNTRILHKANKKVHYCGSDTISKALSMDTVLTWTRKVMDSSVLSSLTSSSLSLSSTSYYESCKFIHARYNCSRFGKTSSTQYQISIASSNLSLSLSCQIPEYFSFFHIFQKISKPFHIIMMGDSHLIQVFQSLLCMYQSLAYDIDVFAANLDSIDPQDYPKFTYANVKDSIECHAIRYEDYLAFYLDPPPAPEGSCHLSHVPGQNACFKLPFGSASSNLYSMICASYVRPLTGEDAVLAGLDLGIRSMEMSLDQFDVIISNAYVSATDLGNFLHAIGYQGRILVLPRYPYGIQSGFQYQEEVIKGHMNHHDSKVLREEIITFCDTINNIYSDRRNSNNICTILDYVNLISQRSDDAKSSIFPMTYKKKKSGQVVVCQEEASEKNNCVGKDFHVCSKEVLPCHKESHFCLPGPTDEFGLLVLAAAISKEDYVIHL